MLAHEEINKPPDVVDDIVGAHNGAARMDIGTWQDLVLSPYPCCVSIVVQGLGVAASTGLTSRTWEKGALFSRVDCRSLITNTHFSFFVMFQILTMLRFPPALARFPISK